MIYETPICEIVEFEEVDIICTSQEDTEETPVVPLPLG